VSDAWKKYSLFSVLLQIYKEEEEQFKDYINFLCSKNSVVVVSSLAYLYFYNF
jgi:hypothetical protein